MQTRKISTLRNFPLNISLFGHLFSDPEREGQDKALVEDIATHGVRIPLVITSSGVILSGHRRKEAALRAGLEEVPVVVKDLPPEARDMEWWAGNLSREKTPEERARYWKLGVKLRKQWAEAAAEEIRARGEDFDGAAYHPVPKATEELAKQIGWSGRTAKKASAVVDAIDDALKRQDDDTAALLRKKLNTQSVDAAYKLTKKPKNRSYSPIKAEPHDAQPIVDGNKKLVPPRLRTVFEKRGTFSTLARRLTTILTEIEHLGTHAAGQLIPLAQVRTETKNLRDAFLPFAPHSMCPDCSEKTDCKTCGGRGWLVAHQFVPSEKGRKKKS